ncbi:FAD-binding domain protein [Apiospora rasikravindrae]|uniref:FAD-binding domain protein n=1 Tax=Apiospora rasikravindrae TaxID=990691 RepID=A0ABR1S102_9PEZI
MKPMHQPKEGRQRSQKPLRPQIRGMATLGHMEGHPTSDRRPQPRGDTPGLPRQVLRPPPNARHPSRPASPRRGLCPSRPRIRPAATPPAAELMNHCRANRIRTYSPGQLEYERSVASTNLLYRYTRPDCVIQPASGDEVARVVKFCFENQIRLTVRSGGHSYAGFATTDEGALMDMRRMNGTSLDMDEQVLYADGGALWADVYKRIINGRHNGYAPNGGRCPSVGVSGFLMGAGLGPFSRGLGMGSDQVLSITAVTARGDTVTVTDKCDPDSPAGRLFWALRGAGGGNFGVVVQWKLRVAKLQDPDGRVTAGRYEWTYKPADFAARGEQEQRVIEDSITSTMGSFYAYNWPDTITIDSTWFHRADNNSGTQVRFISYCDGGSEFFSEHIDRAIQNDVVKRQLKRRCIEERSTRFLHETLAAQWSDETLRTIPNSTEFRLFAGFAVDCRKSMQSMNNIVLAVKEELDVFGEQFKGERAECAVSFIHTGGVAGTGGRADTPYRWREASYQCYIMITFLDKWVERDMRGFLGKFKARLRPWSILQQAVFVNFADAALPRNGYEAAYYGGNMNKLRKVKKEWDPTDFFHWQQSVRLPEESEEVRAVDTHTNALLETTVGDDPPAPAVDEKAEEDLTDYNASRGWDHGLEVPISEPLSSNMFNGNLGNNGLELFSSTKPGTKQNTIKWIYELPESLPLTGELVDPGVFPTVFG